MRKRSNESDRPTLLERAPPALLSVVERAETLAHLDRLLRNALPSTLKDRCQLANVRQQKLVWLVVDPAAGLELVRRQKALLEIANRHLRPAAIQIITRVAPSARRFSPPAERSDAERIQLEKMARILGVDQS